MYFQWHNPQSKVAAVSCPIICNWLRDKFFERCLQVSSNHVCQKCVCWCFILQTRSLLSVFEEDAGMLTTYTNQLLQSLQRVFGAQVLNETQTDAHM